MKVKYNLFQSLIFETPTVFIVNLISEEADTDLETDRLLGQQRTDDQGFYDDKVTIILSQSYNNWFKVHFR